MLIKKNRITPPELDEKNLRRYMLNKMDFRLEQFVFEPSLEAPQGSLFKDVCQQWQLDYIYKPLDERTEEGFPKYRLIYYQLPKKSGKTALLAGEGLVQLLLSSMPSEENYIIAGDKEQASYVLRKIKDFIERNPNFSDLFLIQKNEIIVPSTGAMIQVLSSEASSKQGRNPDFYIFDEFWNQKDRDLFDTMFLGQAAKPSSQGIIITNAGYDR